MQLTILRGPKGPSAYSVGQNAAAQKSSVNPYDFKTQTYEWLEWHRGFDSYVPPPPTTPATRTEESSGLGGEQIALLVVVLLAAVAWNALFVGPLMAVVCVAFVLLLGALDFAGFGSLVAVVGVVIVLLSVL